MKMNLFKKNKEEFLFKFKHDMSRFPFTIRMHEWTNGKNVFAEFVDVKKQKKIETERNDDKNAVKCVWVKLLAGKIRHDDIPK